MQCAQPWQVPDTYHVIEGSEIVKYVKLPINRTYLTHLTQESTTLPSPTKMHKHVELNSNLIEQIDEGKQFILIIHSVFNVNPCLASEGSAVAMVANMLDPDGIYACLLGSVNMNKCHLDIPNVCDGNRTLITPMEYEEKLPPSTVVMVNVYMKMYVHMSCLFLDMLTSYPRWSMRPTNRPQSHFRARTSEENGSHTYQLILNSMQVLPIADISKIALFNSNLLDPQTPKGKHKAQGDADAPPPKKKAATHGKRSGKDTDAMEVE